MTMHKIQDKYPDHLVPSQGWKVERLSGVLNVLEEQLDKYQEKLLEAAHVSPRLLPEEKAKDQHEVLSKAKQDFRQRMQKAIDQVKQSQHVARENLRLKTEPKDFESSSEKLAWQMQKLGVMMQMQSMDSKEVKSLLEEQCRSGDRTLLDICKTGFVKPLVSNPHVLRGAEQQFERAVAQHELNQVEIEDQVAESAEQILKRGEKYLSYLDSQEDRLLEAPSPEPDTSSLSAKDKAQLISELGQDGYLDYVQGRRSLEELQQSRQAA